MKKIKAVLDKITSTVCIIALIAMVLIVTYQVVIRYFFKAPSAVTDALTRYLFVWLITISATYIFGQREHICISYLKDKLSAKLKKTVNIAIEIIIILFALLVMVYGGSVITHMNMLQFDSILKIPTGIIYSVIPVSGLIIIFYSVCNIMNDARSKE